MSKIPALLTTASRRPNSSIARCTMAAPPSSLATESYERHRDASEACNLCHDLVGHARVSTFSVHRDADVVDDNRGTSLCQV